MIQIEKQYLVRLFTAICSSGQVDVHISSSISDFFHLSCMKIVKEVAKHLLPGYVDVLT